MLDKVTKFSLKNFAGLMILVLLCVSGGTFASMNLKIESMPDISYPVIYVATVYPGTPGDVMEQVTKPIEKSVSSMDGIKNMISTSTDNFSHIMILLTGDKKPEDARKDIEALLQNTRLPQGAEKPRIITDGFSSQPVYYLSVVGKEGITNQQLMDSVKNHIEPELTAVQGLDHMDIIGTGEELLSITIDEPSLNKYGYNPTELSGIIQASLSSGPAGSVSIDQKEQVIRIVSEVDQLKGIEELIFMSPAGESFKLKDIAKAEIIQETKSLSRLNDKAAVGIHLYRTSTTNIVDFSAEVDKVLEELKASQPEVTIEPIINGASQVKNTIHGMIQEGLLGALLASIMIFIFLKNARMTLIVLVSIPLSILISILIMWSIGITLNIMTLAGMAIAIGRVVDDSIVVIENIYSQLEKAKERNESIILYATKQVSSAITSSTLTTVAVFVPLGLVSGVVGEVFKPFAITLVCSLMASLLVALTVIPSLAKVLVLRGKKWGHKKTKRDGGYMRAYKKLLTASLKRPIITLFIALIVLVSSFALIVPQLSVGFMPENESDKSMEFQLTLPKTTTLGEMDAQVKEVESMLRNTKNEQEQPLFQDIESLVGFNKYGTSGDKTQFPYISLIVTSVGENADANQVLQRYKEEILTMLPGGSKVEGQIITIAKVDELPDFSYYLKGEDIAALQQSAGMVKEKLKEFPELINIQDNISESKTEINIEVDREKAGQYGLTTAQIMGMVHGWVGELSLGDIEIGGALYRSIVTLEQADKDSIEDIKGLIIKSGTGAAIPLSEVAEITETESPTAIMRGMQEQFVVVNAKIDSQDKAGISKKVTEAMDQIELPGGVSREVQGVSDEIAKSFLEMFMAMAASILFVYFIMVITFGNAKAPFSILFSLPLAAIGGLLALLVTKESLNVSSLIGFLMLIGIVVTNAIVLIDRVQQLREEGYSARDALVEAGLTRTRPILMTAAATVLALLPIAVGAAGGAVISKGLAVVTIGGLITSTLLTLVIVPVVYELLERLSQRFARGKNRDKEIVITSKASGL
jgi:multidrug efflux pump subunit AcrB